MKRVYSILLICFCLICLSGCVRNPENIKLDSTKTLQKYAKENFGDVKYIETIDDPGKNHERICVFEDEERGFQFYVRSVPKSLSIDGSVFGYSGTSIYNNYKEKFQEWLGEQIKPQIEALGFEYREDFYPSTEPVLHSDRVFSMKTRYMVAPIDEMEEDLRKIHSLIYSYEWPEGAGTFYINARTTDKEFFGNIGKEEFDCPGERGIDYMKAQLKKICGIEIERFDKIEWSDKNMIDGLKDQYIEKSSTENWRVKNYYFTYEGEQYLISTALVHQYSKDIEPKEKLWNYQNYTYYEPMVRPTEKTETPKS